MNRKDAFNAVSERNFANGEGRTHATVFEADANAFENLNALFVAFLDFYVDFDGIARFERRNIRPELLFFDYI
jgi:hypothetical protein